MSPRFSSSDGHRIEHSLISEEGGFKTRMAGVVHGYLWKLLMEYSKWKRRTDPRIFLVLKTLTMIFACPALLLLCGWMLDALLRLTFVLPLETSTDLGFILVLVGWALALWAVRTEMRVMMSFPNPDEVIIKLMGLGPFKYVRHPYALGLMLFYFGVGSLFRSASTVFLLIPTTFTLALYRVRYVTERQLELRLGREYSSYQEKVPFLFPRLMLRKEQVMGDWR